jgi:hypothetical protein
MPHIAPLEFTGYLPKLAIKSNLSAAAAANNTKRIPLAQVQGHHR